MKNKTNTPQVAVATYQTLDDFKASVLIVSVLVNLFVLTAWLVAQTSAIHAAQLMTLI